MCGLGASLFTRMCDERITKRFTIRIVKGDLELGIGILSRKNSGQVLFYKAFLSPKVPIYG